MLTENQLATLTVMIRAGMVDASKAMSTWLERAISIEVEPIKQISLTLATEQLGTGDEAIYVCWMRVAGHAQGQLLLGFDNRSGLSLCNLLLNLPTLSENWGELERSAVLETTNIVGCAFLNTLHRVLSKSDMEAGGASLEKYPMEERVGSCIPSPPVFLCDYAAAIMQFVLADQFSTQDAAIVAKTELWISPLTTPWHFMFIPDSVTIERLARLL